VVAHLLCFATNRELCDNEVSHRAIHSYVNGEMIPRMVVKFELFGVLRHMAGRKEIPVEIPEGATLGSAVDRLISQDAPEIAHFLVTADGVYTANFVVAGAKVAASTVLCPNDSVRVLLAAGGG